MRLLACVKTNIARKPPTLRYTVDVSADDIPYLTWHGVADVTAQGALDGPAREVGGGVETEAENSRRKVRQYGIAFLRDVLVNGPMPWSAIVAAGHDDGFTEHLLRLARADAGLIKVIETGGNRGVRWALPADPEGETDSPPAASDDPSCRLPPASTAIARALDADGKRQMEAPATEADREVALDAMPDVCTVCGATDAVLRFPDPWWTVRCIDHDPYEYRAA
jgi:hypothetical protein